MARAPGAARCAVRARAPLERARRGSAGAPPRPVLRARPPGGRPRPFRPSGHQVRWQPGDRFSAAADPRRAHARSAGRTGALGRRIARAQQPRRHQDADLTGGNMDFGLSSEQRLLGESVRKVMDRLATPQYVRRLDSEAAYPYELYDAWTEMGLLRMPFPEAHGGLGGTLLDMVIIAEELARKSFDFFTAYGASVFCGLNLLRLADSAQPDRRSHGAQGAIANDGCRRDTAPQGDFSARNVFAAATAPFAPRSLWPAPGKRTKRFGALTSAYSRSPKAIGTTASRSPCSTSTGAATLPTRKSERNWSFINQRTGTNQYRRAAISTAEVKGDSRMTRATGLSAASATATPVPSDSPQSTIRSAG